MSGQAGERTAIDATREGKRRAERRRHATDDARERRAVAAAERAELVTSEAAVFIVFVVFVGVVGVAIVITFPDIRFWQSRATLGAHLCSEHAEKLARVISERIAVELRADSLQVERRTERYSERNAERTDADELAARGVHRVVLG